MRHLHILCEGQTEEIVAQTVIEPYFSSSEVWVDYSIYKTKRPAGGLASKGGLSRWSKLEPEVRKLLKDSSTTVELHRIVHQESGPELVDDGVDTAPSKRILNAYPRYTKTSHGPLVIADAGLDLIRNSCPHADQWLTDLEARLRR